MAPTDCSLQTQEITWLQGRLTLLRSLLRIICSSPAAPAPATLEAILAEVLAITKNLRVWIPLLPARFRHTKSLWAPAVDHLLSSLLPDEDAAQHGLLLPDLALAVAAAVHAKQIPVQDLLGCVQFITPAKPLSVAKGRPAVTQAFARLVFQAFIDADGDGTAPASSTCQGQDEAGSTLGGSQAVIKDFMQKASRHVLSLVKEACKCAADLWGPAAKGGMPGNIPSEHFPKTPAVSIFALNIKTVEYALELMSSYGLNRLDINPEQDSGKLDTVYEPRVAAEEAYKGLKRPAKQLSLAQGMVAKIAMGFFDMCVQHLPASDSALHQQQLRSDLQAIFEGCLTQLESHGPVQLILSCTADLLDSGRFSELQLASLATLASWTLVHLLGIRVVRLADLLAAVEGNQALARHELTQTYIDLIYGNLLPLLQSRHQSGPVAVMHLDLGAVLQSAWNSFLQEVAGSKTPVTQAGLALDKNLGDRGAAASASAPRARARVAAAREKLAQRQAAAQQAATATAAAQAAGVDGDFEEATVDAAMHASDLVSQEEEALISAQQARRRNAAKKQRQKQRKQAQSLAHPHGAFLAPPGGSEPVW